MRRVAARTLVSLLACAAVSVAVAAEPPARLLVVTVTNGFRHSSIGTAEPVLEELGRSSGLFHVDFLRLPPGRPVQPQPPKRAAGTSDADWQKQEAAHAVELEAFRVADAAWQKGLAEQFAQAFSTEGLAGFDGMIFASTTGELPIPDLDAFLAWIKSGKAFIGFHAATDTLRSSDAYVDLVGGHFAGHPWNAGGEHAFVVHDTRHRLAAMFPERFRWQDEIYQYDLRYNPDSLRVLVSLDMQASTPQEPWHVPVSWVRDYGKGRVFYTNFGHNEATWNAPEFQKHATEGIAWALGRFDAPAEPNPQAQAAEYVRSVVAACAAATGRKADELRAQADRKIAADPDWAVRLRPELVALRSLDAAARTEGYDAFVAEVEKP